MKVREITPQSFRCVLGACPAVFETDRGTLLLVGRQLTAEQAQEAISGRVADGEAVVELPRELLLSAIETIR